MVINVKCNDGKVVAVEDLNLIFRSVYKGSIDIKDIYFDYFANTENERKVLIDLFLDIYSITSGEKVFSPFSKDTASIESIKFIRELEDHIVANNTNLVTVETAELMYKMCI